jgi:hypothetical protein
MFINKRRRFPKSRDSGRHRDLGSPALLQDVTWASDGAE